MRRESDRKRNSFKKLPTASFFLIIRFYLGRKKTPEKDTRVLSVVEKALFYFHHERPRPSPLLPEEKHQRKEYWRRGDLVAFNFGLRWSDNRAKDT